jgi:hypothetical protein
LLFKIPPSSDQILIYIRFKTPLPSSGQISNYAQNFSTFELQLLVSIEVLEKIV